MSERYYVSHVIEGGSVKLRGTEARHLAVVDRHQPGDTVRLFDGSGAEFQARLVSVGRHEVLLELIAREEISRELPGRLVLASALPKGDRQRWLVEKAVELGVARFVPLLTQRSVVRPRDKGSERLNRVVIEASKQCGRNTLMKIAAPTDWKSFLMTTAGADHRWLADPAAPLSESALKVPHLFEPAGSEILVAIGPEGGFTQEERTLAVEAGWTCHGLGRRTLRIETAAIVCCTIAAGFLSRLDASNET